MAKFELKLPKMGESVAEATITNWLKNVGESIAADEAVLEIATDKVDSEVPSEVSGTLVEILFQVNDVVKVGQTIVTSSYSTIFPENIPLGKVLKVDYDEGGNFYLLKVKLTTNFTNLTSVYIINNLMKDEIDLLKQKSEEEGEEEQNPQSIKNN